MAIVVSTKPLALGAHRVHWCYHDHADVLSVKDASGAYVITHVGPDKATHAVECERRVGWGLRHGRLPVCPEHRQVTDAALLR